MNPPQSIRPTIRPSHEPSPAALAWATRLTEIQFRDVYLLASMVDEVAEEARVNERRRIFNMGFFELCREFWRGEKIRWN
jgi:hypothetical protein